MRGLKQMLLQEQKYLEDIVNKAKTGLPEAPEGHLRISKDKDKIRYYHCTEDNSGIYIPKSDKIFTPKAGTEDLRLVRDKKGGIETKAN